jgi:hypothetical protein
MNTSASITKLSVALVKAQGELNAVSKDGKNPHFKSTYATLQNIVESTRDVLHRHGLAVVQTFSQTDGTYIELTTTLVHESGEWISGTITMRPTKPDPQGLGSAATYARRYAYAAILGIVTDDDDDGNAASAPNNDRASQGKYEGDTREWLNVLDRDGKLTDKGTKVALRLAEDGEAWMALEAKYRMSSATRTALKEVVDKLRTNQQFELTP